MRWLLVSLACAVAGMGVAFGGLSTPAPAAGVDRAGAASTAIVVEAHSLPGDVLVAGPVVLDGRFAVWAEEGPRRLLLRSLDIFGRTRTIFSTSRAEGVRQGSRWVHTVSTLVAGSGRVAFVDLVAPCNRYPTDTHYPYCDPGITRNAWNTATVYAGRPGAIRAVEGTRHLCATGAEPLALAVARPGLVVFEGTGGCPPARYRAVLRGFGGRLVRILSHRFAEPLAAGGDWAGFPWGLARVSSGRQVGRSPRGEVNDITVDRSGRFAYLIFHPPPGNCQPTVLSRLVVGRIGQPGRRVITTRAEADSDILAWNAVAIAGQQVAFMHAPGPCVQRGVVMVAGPDGAPRAVPGIDRSTSLAFDGHLLAALHGTTVQLTATGCPGPTVPAPSSEPAYRPGRPEVVSGMYVQGGPLPPPPCKPEPRGPYAGTITVTDLHTGATVAEQKVSDGHLAHIRLAPGAYDLIGHFASGVTPAPVKIKIRRGYRTRQDCFENVP